MLVLMAPKQHGCALRASEAVNTNLTRRSCVRASFVGHAHSVRTMPQKEVGDADLDPVERIPCSASHHTVPFGEGQP